MVSISILEHCSSSLDQSVANILVNRQIMIKTCTCSARCVSPLEMCEATIGKYVFARCHFSEQC